MVYLSKDKRTRGSHCGSAVTNPTSIHEDAGSICGLAQWVKDPALPRAVYRSQMWLGSRVAMVWHGPAATAAIGPLAWEPPHAVGAALKKEKEKKKMRPELYFKLF